MTIATTVPASTKTPGFYFEFNVANAARGLVPLPRRIAIVAAQGATATKTVVTVNQVFSEADADSFYEQGSEAALMAKFGLRAGKNFGKAAEIWAVGIAPVGVAATFTFTVTGTATAAGDIVLGIAGRQIRVPVNIGDINTVVAAQIVSSIDEQLVNLPVTASAAVGVVTTLANQIGVNGNDVFHEVVSSITGTTVVAAAAIAGTGAYDITAALDILNDKDYEVVAAMNHTSVDIADFASHLVDMFAPGTKRWRHTIMGERGTLGTAQALATAADDFKQMVVSAEGFRNTPGELAMSAGTRIAAEDDVTLPFNGVDLAELALPDPADIPTQAEKESGIGGGLLMLTTNEAQTRAEIVRAVTTQVTLSSAPFFVMLDVTISKGLFEVARQGEIAQKIAFARAKKSERTKRRVRSIWLRVLFDLEDAEVVQNVAANAGELVVEDINDDPTLSPDRFNVAVPTSIIPPLNIVANVLNLITE